MHAPGPLAGVGQGEIPMAEMWYYTSEGKQMEPVTAPELKQLAASGLLKPTDMVWKEGMPKWVRASSAQGLFDESGGAFKGSDGPGQAASAPAKTAPAKKGSVRAALED